MATTVGDIAIDIRAKMDRLQADMDEAKAKVKGGMNEMQALAGVFAGYMAAIGIGNLGGLINSTIEAAAALKHLSEKTGATVEGLSAIKSVAKLSGTDIDTVAAAMNKLTKNMTDTSEEAKGAAQGIKALGLNFDDFKKLSPDQRMLAVAQAMDKFKEGVGKSEVAMLLFGQKAGANMLPMLADLAEKGNLNGKVTTEQAEAADKFEKQLIKLKSGMEGMVRSAVLPLLEHLSLLGPLLKLAGELVAAYVLIFVAMPAVLMLAKGAFDAVMLAMVETGTVAGLMNTTIMNIGPTFAELTAKFGVMKTVMLSGFGILAAAYAGWEFGTMLSERFIQVRLAGVAMVDGLMTAWQYLKYGAEVAWLGIKAAAGSALEWVGSAMATLLEKMAGGLNFVGMTNAAETVKGYADALRETTTSATDFTTEHAALEAGLASAVAGVHAITTDMADEAIAQFNSAKATNANGDAKAALVVPTAKAAKEVGNLKDKIAEVIGKLDDEYLMLHMTAQQAEIYRKQKEAGVVALSAEAKAIAAKVVRNMEEKAAIDAVKKAMDDATKSMEAYDAANLREVVTISDAIKAEEFRIETLGMSRAAVEALKLVKMEDAMLDARRAQDDPEIKRLQNLIEWQKKYAATVARGDVADANKKIADDTAKWWQKTYDDVEKSLTNALINGFEKGKSFWDSFKDYIVNGAKSMLVKIAVQPIMGAVGSMFGMGSTMAGGSGGAGGGGDSMGILSTLFSAGGAISEGITGIGAAMMNGPLSSILGDMGASLVANSTAIAGAIPYVGAALAAVGLLKNVMDYKVEATGNALTATVGSTGVLNGKVGTRADFTQTGGFMGGGVTKNSSWGVADAGTTGYIDAAVRSVTAANAAYAAILGLDASALDGFTKALDINTTGMDAAAAQTAINTEVNKFGAEQAAAAYGEVLAQYTKTGETVQDTLKRLASIEIASSAINELGGVFSRVATLGIEGRDSMFALAGGIEAFIKKSSDFVKDYYSKDEQSGIQARTVLAQLNAAGVTDASQLSNKEEFRALVESIDVSNQSGREQLNALLTIAPQFAQVSEYLKSNNIDLGDLAALAPAIAALDPLFQQNNDAATSNATAAADATTASIQATTDAVTSGTNAVVAAVNNVAATVAAAVRDGMAVANAANAQVGRALDDIASSNRLELAGG